MLKGLIQRTDGQLRKNFKTIVHAFKHAVENKPDTIAIICGKSQATYREYAEGAARTAAFLKAGKLQKGDRVVICANTSLSLPMIILGAMAAGAQVTLINPLYTEREIKPLLDITEPTMIFCDAVSIDVIKDISVTRRITLINISDPKNTWQDLSITSLPKDLPNADDGAVIMFTGGTTGVSKGVPHNHAKIMAAIEIMEDRWPTDLNTDLLLNVPPIFHITGLYHGCFQPIFGCNGLILLPRFHPELVFEAVKKYPVSAIIIGVPTAYAAMLGHPDFDKVNFSEIKFCGSGGAPLSDKIKREWENRTGVPALEGYGMTEGAPTCNNPLVGQRKSYSAGRPVACTDFKIVDVKDGSKQMPTGKSGEIIVKGPHIADSYFNDKNATASAIRNGWLHTGDIAYIDDDGFVFIIDRLKDMAIVSGFNVFPREIDEVLMAHPKIREAAAIGIPDDYRGEIIKVFVSLRAGETLDEEALLTYCADNLVKYKIPTIIEFTIDLPKTPVGKIDKRQLKISGTYRS